ncbi:hypothetical protein LMH87_001974 [Akanthomyces muscarius]|uniref:Small nuclear ribonucleoprotein Prp3 C-terminal domain-containing protein n=1 Tax=Akanthomyces muscarius TaxID=2231603 RepID=A0A9W8UIY6_AKAMU|nr:hypothetical protein LMH87_001974 [Akanthomyces muscarius]KAJ4147459.1 hypothetical protein LMH87_001974 [Akanthomyces muscarius]
MGSDDVAGTLLSQELLEGQLGQIDLLIAMYPVEGSVTMSDFARANLERLRETVVAESSSIRHSELHDIDLFLELEIAGDRDDAPTRVAQLSIAIPLQHQGHITEEAPPARVRLQQPSWMSKAEVNHLMSELSSNGDLFTTIDDITSAASTYLSQVSTQEAGVTSQPRTEALTRVWFYFPSISTRAKRDDLVNHAPSYGLTGFLLAGKPGILCLEGGSQAVDDYMKFIKTESWGDIPAHHKKVSERYRQPGLDARAFADMQEITGELERRGERANRNDMRALEAWLGRGRTIIVQKPILISN